jgi:lysylphosphatidylglycerol synthetase-like protein (DUF2156 family)
MLPQLSKGPPLTSCALIYIFSVVPLIVPLIPALLEIHLLVDRSLLVVHSIVAAMIGRSAGVNDHFTEVVINADIPN